MVDFSMRLLPLTAWHHNTKPGGIEVEKDEPRRHLPSIRTVSGSSTGDDVPQRVTWALRLANVSGSHIPEHPEANYRTHQSYFTVTGLT